MNTIKSTDWNQLKQRLISRGWTAERIKADEKILKVTLEGMASEVIATCKSGKVPFNLQTIQNVIKKRSAVLMGFLMKN